MQAALEAEVDEFASPRDVVVHPSTPHRYGVGSTPRLEAIQARTR
jgi:hypothetical protein